MARQRAIDQAREWRKRVLEQYPAGPAPDEPVAGVAHRPSERFVYLSLLKDEGAGRQLNRFFRYCGEIAKLRGSLPAGFSSGQWTITLVSGERFHAIRAGWPEDDPSDRAEAALSLLREYATTTGRLTGVIEGSEAFVCDDGRRVPLVECSCRPLVTEDDYAPPKRGRRP